MAKKNPQNRNIIRVINKVRPSKVVEGFEVRIVRRGQRFSRFFSDRKYGKRRALKLARTLRDEMESKLKTYSRKEKAQKVTAKNTSGQRGVRLRITKIIKPDKIYIYEHVEASWSPTPNVVVKKSFSVEKFGLELAWRMAVICRKRALFQLDR